MARKEQDRLETEISERDDKISGYLIEFPLTRCTLHFTVPVGIDSVVFKRIRDLIPENFRLTVALNI